MSLLQDMHNEVQVLTRLAYVDTTTPAMEVLDVRDDIGGCNTIVYCTITIMALKGYISDIPVRPSSTIYNDHIIRLA